MPYKVDKLKDNLVWVSQLKGNRFVFARFDPTGMDQEHFDEAVKQAKESIKRHYSYGAPDLK